MGLFGKSKSSDKKREKVKSQVDKLMKQYDEEKLDGATYIKKMVKLTKKK